MSKIRVTVFFLKCCFPNQLIAFPSILFTANFSVVERKTPPGTMWQKPHAEGGREAGQKKLTSFAALENFSSVYLLTSDFFFLHVREIKVHL